MSIGILALKVGLVVTVTGVSVATPILLNRGYKGSSTVSLGSEGMIGAEEQNKESQTPVEPAASGVESHADVSQADSERERDGQNTLQRTSGSKVSHSSTAKIKEFDKECFIVPAESTKGNSVELLTCYSKGRRIQADAGESDEELESLFHLYDKGGSNNPVLIDGSLIWNPTNRQLTAKLTKNIDTDSEHTFKATGEHWGNISNKSIDLLQGRGECAIYKATLRGVSANSTHLLACGNDSSKYDSSDPKGIPLSLWKQK